MVDVPLGSTYASVKQPITPKKKYYSIYESTKSNKFYGSGAKSN